MYLQQRILIACLLIHGLNSQKSLEISDPVKKDNICTELSCVDKCNRVHGYSACSCNDSCLIWNNCCWDFLPVCKNISGDNSAIIGYLSNVTKDEDDSHIMMQSYGKCINYAYIGYRKVIGICPEGTSEDHMKDCHENSENMTPVRVRNDQLLNFANLHCALCHGYDIKALIPWSFKYKCPSNLTIDLQHIVKHCIKDYDETPVELICYPRNEDVSDAHELSLLCEHYIRPIKFTDTVYINEHCAMINSSNATKGEAICPPHHKVGASLTVLFDINQGSVNIEDQTYSLCSIHQIYDPYFILCRDLICPQYHYPKYGHCYPNNTVYINTDQQPFPYLNSSIQALFTMYFVNSTSNFMDYFHEEKNWRLVNYSIIPLQPSIHCKEEVQNSSGHFLIEIDSTPNEDVMDDIFELVKAEPCISNAVVTNIIPGYMNCEVGHLVSYSNISLATNPSDNINKTKYGVTDKDGQIFYYKLYSIGFKLDVRRYLVTGLIDEILVCSQENVTLSCPLIVFNPGEFQMLNNSIQIKGTNKIILEDQFQIVNHTAYVCEFYTSSGFQFFKLDKNHQLVTVIVTVVSMLCLLITIFIYLGFSELRNLSGKLNVGLCLWLFLGQGALLVDMDDKSLCQILAVFVHFFWLCAFSQMSAIAINMALTFHKMTISDAESDGIRFKRLLCGSLVPPIIIIAICICLDVGVFGDTIKIGYGQSTCSWMYNEMEIIVIFFYTPVCTSLLVNAVCFIITLCGIEKSIKVSNIAMRENPRRDRQRCLIYTKLSSIMGFTWITGIIAALVDNSILWYIFIILDGLQGFFIFLSFICNRRTLYLVSHCFRNDRSNIYSASSSKSRATRLKTTA